ncbi:Na+/H+ antiporter NhaC [Luminiphilus syltensis NOR5-1B]|uniref:Na+/H+ antiporter NhaC n=1 Tax=Luminiphilus syltensis NOR5-1B TaxID=565045 RepID=B8KTK9_9GAMM|nr:Na+/H+ antiporter NhaC family protein [Luminiphilus syltensis]EED34757.1 Na+/H+ antiporter NhaC [Luminiphilus syltensis NOR5-1B]
MDYGIISLVPTALVLFLAIWSHRTLESVIAGSLLAFLIMDGINFIESLSSTIMTVVGDEVTVWIVLVCGLYGPFIALLVKGGGSYAFGQMLTRRIHSKKASLLTTWVLGLSIFLDDYLNSLTVGATMKSVTDRFRVSREMLAYVVDSTAAPMCLLVPISSWGVYFAGLLEKNEVAAPGEGIAQFVAAIPYMFYPIVAIIVVPLAVTRVIPLLGRMRTVELRAEETGDLGIVEDVALTVEPSERGGVSVFFVPIFALLFFTVVPEVDLLRGVIIGILVTLVQYTVMRIMPLGELLDTCMDGLKSMIPVLSMLIALFVFVEANMAIGMTEYVINGVRPYLTAELLPVLIFITMSVVSYTTGSNWGVIAIAMPIAFPLAHALDVNMALVIGALLSASGFGSHACFYSDSTVLSAQGAGCRTYDHAITQLPYALLAAGIAAVFYLIAPLV